MGICHEGFPQDGRCYWVRWIDVVDPLGGNTASPRVEVMLSRLPKPFDSVAPMRIGEALRDDDGTDRMDFRALVFAGDLPSLSAGLVVRDGRRVGHLAMQRRTFRFGAGAAFSPPMACRDPSPASSPPSWDGGIPWTVLPEAAYPLGRTWCNSRCVTVHHGSTQLVLPCMEVFRYFYAPESLSANVLLSGPFSLKSDKLLNPDFTTRREDGSWQVGLRSGLTGDAAFRLGSLFLTRSGREAANRLFRTLPLTARISAGHGYRMLEAGIPFDWTEMEISVRGLQLYPNRKAAGILDKFLGLMIETVVWPIRPAGVPDVVRYRLDNNTTFHGGEPDVDPPKPGGVTERPVAGPTGELRSTGFMPPSLGSETTFEEISHTPPAGGPEVVRMPLEEGDGPPVRRRITKQEDVRHVSTGTAQLGPTGAARMRYVPADGEVVHPHPSRFAALAKTLGELHGAGSIDGWEVIPEASSKLLRDGMPVWAFPGQDPASADAIAWSFIMPRYDTPRAALVLRIRISGRIANWLEIELRGNEGGYHSFVFLDAGCAPSAKVLSSLLLAVALKTGNWKTSGALKPRVGVSATAIVRHGGASNPFPRDGVLAALVSILGPT